MKITKEELKKYFLNNHTLKECAAFAECHENTVRRQLRKIGLDTSIYNYSKLAKEKHKDICGLNISEETLKELYINKELSSIEISKQLNVHSSSIVKLLHKYNLTKPHEIILDIPTVVEYFKTHSLGQCAIKFGCSEVTIKRKLRKNNIDTSIHNNSELALQINKTKNKSELIPSKEYLIQEYIVNNKDTIEIATELKLSKSTIRKYIQSYGIIKSDKNQAVAMSIKYFKKTGYRHPGQNPITIQNINKRKSRFEYINEKGIKHLFKSLHELCYALLLDNNTSIVNWDYELITIPYIDSQTGKHRLYYIDFSVQTIDKNDYWLEVKPQESMIPSDKRLYATQQASKAGIKFRGLTNKEKEDGYNLFKSGFKSDKIKFMNVNKEFKPHKTYTLWFKIKDEIPSIDTHYQYTSIIGPYVKCKFIPKDRNNTAKSI